MFLFTYKCEKCFVFIGRRCHVTCVVDRVRWKCDLLCCLMLNNNMSNEHLWTAQNFLTQPARDLEQSALVRLVVHALVSADSTGHGCSGFRRIRAVLDNH